MARPRKDSPEPSARERLIEAFWALLEERPYAQITLSDVARAAGVRRNTFYYHYANVSDLAEDALRGYIPVALQGIGALRAGRLDQHLSMLFASDPHNLLARRMTLIAGPHGTMELIGVVKGIVWELWIDMLGIDESKRPLFEFVIGGLLSSASYLMTLAPEERQRIVQDKTLQDVLAGIWEKILPEGLPDPFSAS